MNNNKLNLQDISVQALLGNLQEYIKQKENITTAVTEDKTAVVDKEDLQQAIIQLITGNDIDGKVKMAEKDKTINENTEQVNKADNYF